MSLHHIKRMSKKADVDRAWLEYYTGRLLRAERRRPGEPNRRILRVVPCGDGVHEMRYHATKGWRRRVA